MRPSSGRRGLRALLAGASLALVGVLAWHAFLDHVARPSAPPSSASLSPAARALVERAVRGLERERVADHHVHIVGLGAGGTGAWVNPGLRELWSPRRWVRFQVYRRAVGFEDVEHADAQVMARLDAYAAEVPGRLHLMAFDYFYTPAGAPDFEHSELHVPNAYVFDLAARNPQRYRAVMSVHPYRRDALETLREFAARGGRMVKWLPSAMGIDPADPRLASFYDELRALDLTLISHAGEERAVESPDHQALGNPLRLRAALDRGVRVVVAHCASNGQDDDLDHPGARADSFDLFLRLMDDPRYRDLVFGEISALTLFNRMGRPLETMLRRQDLHARLLNGSDYPLPAIDALIRTGELHDFGYLSHDDARALDEIFLVNPLLFDLALKRVVRAPGTDLGFAADVFYERPFTAAR